MIYIDISVVKLPDSLWAIRVHQPDIVDRVLA